DLGRVTKIVTQKDDKFTSYKKDVTHRNNQGIETTVHTGEKRPTTYTEAINIEKINKELVKADLNIDKFKNKWNKKVNNLQDKYGAFINPQDLSTLNSFKTQLNSLNTDSSKKEIQDLSFALDFVISKMKEFGISQKKYTVDLAKTEVKRQTQVKKFRDDNLDKIDNTISQYSGKVSKTALVDLENLRTKIENINVADRSINANGLKEYRKEIQNTIKVVKDYAEYTKTENKRQTDVSNFKVKSTDDIDKLLNQYKLTGSKDLIKELKNVKKEIQGIDVADQEFDSKGIKEFTRRIGLLQEDLKNTKTLTKQETEQVIKLSTELAQMYRNNELVRLSVNKTGLVTATVRRADSNVEENRYYQYDRENPTKKLTSVGKDYTYINNMQKEISSFKKSAINTIDDVVLKFSKLIPQKTLTDLQKMREEISKIKITDNNINTKFLDEQSIKIKKLTSEARQLGQEQLRINKGLTFTESFKTAMERVPVWFAAMSVFYGGLRKISEGINYLIDLDNAMNQIRIVMNLNNEEAVKLGKSYNELAKSMSVTTTEIANASVEFARQGLNQEQMNNRLQNTIKYAKISGMEFKETAEIITATVNSMGISAERAVDVFSYLGRQNCPLVA
ncbi:MAG: phage tail tape measure protein, partial [Candidatus Cloacimonetes bacterium]|nr:phage tail tape measure protein [Candidatus Cloacimonadota bacterium]